MKRTATLTCSTCRTVVGADRRQCPTCGNLVYGRGQRHDLLARALPRTRATAKLRAELRAYRRQQMRNVDALAAALRGLKGREIKIEVTR